LESVEQELLLEGRGDFQIVDLARFMILDCGMKSTLEYWSQGKMNIERRIKKEKRMTKDEHSNYE